MVTDFFECLAELDPEFFDLCRYLEQGTHGHAAEGDEKAGDDFEKNGVE